jgi:predicted nucleic acid-binding protein
MIQRRGTLLDSNIIIHAARAENGAARRSIMEEAPAVSAASYVEVLGFHKLTDPERTVLEEFFAAIRVLPIDDPVVNRGVTLRQQRRMSLGDAFIAATALVHTLTLVTHNTADFRWISGLHLLDPLAGEGAGN